MKLYSLNGKEPDILPSRIRLDNGDTRTHLNSLSDEELNSLGFDGPFYIPEYNQETQTYFWNGESYEIRELSVEEINLNREKSISYIEFWDNFVTSNLYNKFRLASVEEVKFNVFFTEFISIFSDAKLGLNCVEKIQKYINILFLIYPIDENDKNELSECLKVGNLDLLYKIPNDDFSTIYEYSWEKNDFIILPPTKPFNSWIWRTVDGQEKWNAPIDFPYKTPEGENYIWEWNEDVYQADNTTGWILKEISPQSYSSWTYDDVDGWKPPSEPEVSGQNTWNEELYIMDNTKGWV